ncbi:MULTISPECIES: hypothetical protein [Cyanophyceae]|uniref:Uncharacterized protein n=1 Tax=Nodularia spumigena CENA596 TaxID=1819295 RepID=A0A161VM04_NODSP|nr:MULTISPECIES: hypothetical protein [Cyanophyceae]MDB9357135.1 hypothetical protein [Nodularia spumigena CS-587/03]KZL47755.1 hypothetical protein A2T98_21680 [Nodularia spumigena CENA596]MDB9304482.1 hypothetical protein [Nodularia spumigena CS-591/12]MDB9320175.1 hypothetical protein [Nodularia spumigena CS-590/01A]MDB9324471.1 hypothetical protein [Nodularia spumigena CS-591/07A]
MKRVFSWLQNILLRQIFIVFLIGVTFFSFQIFNYGNDIAKADTVKTPEGIYYKGTPDNNAPIRNDQQVKNAQKNLKETAENVREKLNLDEPTPKATKEFLDSVQTQVEETVEPITGTRHGYYQENRPEMNNR